MLIGHCSLMLNNIPLSGYITVDLSIHHGKGSLVLATMNKAAINIHTQVFVWTLGGVYKFHVNKI